MSSKNHISGKKIQGSHTTIIDKGAGFLRSLENEPWLSSIRAGIISNARRAAQKSLSIKTPHNGALHKNTLKLVLRTSSKAQEIFVEVKRGNQWTAIIDAIKEKARKKLKGFDIYVRER